MQVTGQAKYCDDIACPPETLYAGLVMSARPHARILSVDASAALKVRLGSPQPLRRTQLVSRGKVFLTPFFPFFVFVFSLGTSSFPGKKGSNNGSKSNSD